MLRDERQVALDAAIVAAKNAADAYDDAADIAQDPDVGALFRSLSRRRDAMAAALEPHLRELGDLPSDPDVETETLGQVWRHLKATLATDEQQPLVQEAATLEETLLNCLQAAADAGLPDAATALLLEFRAEVERDRSGLPSAPA